MAELDFERARRNMVERQLRPWQVLDERVLIAMAEVPREWFVPADWRHSAYADIAIPLPGGRSMLPPNVAARALQSLALRGEELLLVIGDGTGYLSACAARLVQQVVNVEANAELVADARARHAALGIDNISCELGDARGGWPREIAYDGILLAGALVELPELLLSQLAEGGRLFAILGDPRAPVMTATLVERLGPRDWRREGLFETRLAALNTDECAPTFIF